VGDSVNKDLINSRVREINDSLRLLEDLLSRRFEDLSVYERLSVRYLVIQLVEAAASICLHILMEVYGERAEGYPDCF
jgi:uncharacterized protein YutE (UPF0331/DUF86 family)